MPVDMLGLLPVQDGIIDPVKSGRHRAIILVAHANRPRSAHFGHGVVNIWVRPFERSSRRCNLFFYLLPGLLGSRRRPFSPARSIELVEGLLDLGRRRPASFNGQEYPVDRRLHLLEGIAGKQLRPHGCRWDRVYIPIFRSCCHHQHGQGT